MISKHLMLLFIFQRAQQMAQGKRFQNISCYCLSRLKQDDKDYIQNFKTSHVIVYP